MKNKKTKNYLGRDFSKTRETDKISKTIRSKVMSKIRSKGTKFETDFIEKLKEKTNLEFEKNVKDIKGKPDIVFREQMLCIFLDSDFWHGWQYPRWKHLLKNNFWREKIEKNRLRDKNTTRFLRQNGWKVIRIWEHNIKNDFEREIIRILKEIIN